jgi:intracellular septation protein
MKLLFDFLPLVVFFIFYRLFDIYVATEVLMAAMLVQILLMKLFNRPVEKMQWITLGLVLVFGGLTLGLRNPQFIMWKPTVINWLFAAALLFSEWFMAQGFMRRMLASVADFPATVVVNLNYAWAAFLVAAGALNLYVAYNFPEDIWVDFKLFGLTGLSAVFIIGQSLYLARHIPRSETVGGDGRED